MGVNPVAENVAGFRAPHNVFFFEVFPTYTAALLLAQVDRGPSVRRWLIEFLTAAVAVRCTAPIITQAAPCLAALLVDDDQAVAKQAAMAAIGLLQAGMALHAAHPQVHLASSAGAAAAAAALVCLQMM
jgi:hypothetical protein